MAGRALMWSGLVKQDRSISDIAEKLVTVPARNLHVPALEGEVRPRLVVKQGRFPSRSIVATVTRGVRAVPRKLLSMGIFVATRTRLGSGIVNHVLHCEFQVWRFMAFHAIYRPMCAGQVERRRGMVEAKLLCP